MRSLFLAILAGLAVSSAACAQDTFKVKVDQPAHGRVTVTPEIPENGRVKAELVIVEDAGHAFFDWKPDRETKDIFAQYGVPYAADMMRFFDEVFYK